MILSSIAHLTSEEMLRAFHCDMSIGFVHINRRSEALGDFLCEADLLLGDQFIGQTLWL